MNDPVKYLVNYLNSPTINSNEKIQLNKFLNAFLCRLNDFIYTYKLHHSNCLSLNRWFLLTDMNLSNIQLKLMPNENVFSNLPNLQRLWLCNNQIETLNNCLIKCYSLIELRLNSNQLHSIHKQLYKLHCLEILDLSLNHLSNLLVS
ncbi:hypothetical protein MN116_006657 [Schistosoma mekongi]|uniref:Uncharacterized protein n=1 Tax=Schistosoma mekongi TaxID=38744 RepID=A0AAE1Z808_SCHME|nr:hypothetical protein MN116_006657 [Schistosoma mekongi]